MQFFYVYQIVGGNMFNVIMDFNRYNIGEEVICIICIFFEDFFNYWMVIFYFCVCNGILIWVLQWFNIDFDGVCGGGMIVYYMVIY